MDEAVRREPPKRPEVVRGVPPDGYTVDQERAAIRIPFDERHEMVVRHDRPEPWIVAEEPVGKQGGSVGDGQYQAVGAPKGGFKHAVGYVSARVDYLHLPVGVLVYVVEHAGELFASVVSVCRNGYDDFGPGIDHRGQYSIFVGESALFFLVKTPYSRLVENRHK